MLKLTNHRFLMVISTVKYTLKIDIKLPLKYRKNQITFNTFKIIKKNNKKNIVT